MFRCKHVTSQKQLESSTNERTVASSGSVQCDAIPHQTPNESDTYKGIYDELS